MGKSFRFVPAFLGLALLAAAPAARAANIPLLTGPQDPSQLIATLNTLIQAINSGVAGLLNAQTASVATGTGTAEQTLQTYTMPANTLSAAGQAVRVTCWGTTAANGNNKTMKLYFGASVISTGTLTLNNKSWTLNLLVMRTAAATQVALGTGIGDATDVATYTNAGTDDLTAGVVIKCTGQDGTSSAADITATAMTVELVK